MTLIRSSPEYYLERLAPFLFHCGLLSFDQNDRTLKTGLDTYQLFDDTDIEEVIVQAVRELEAMLPKLAVLKVEGGNISILQAKSLANDCDAEIFTSLPIDRLTDEDHAVLLEIIEAQGGQFKEFGYFRFDLMLRRQNLYNCSNCGEIWKSIRENPIRCPKCREPLPPRKAVPRYANIMLPLFDEVKEDCIKACQAIREPELLHDRQPLMNCHMEGPGTMNGEQVAMSYENELDITIASTLASLLDNYDSEYLNLARSPEENDAIINILDGGERSLEHLLETVFPEQRFWTDATRPIGNWPATPWIAFGVMDGSDRKDMFHGAKEDVKITCDVLFDTDSGIAALVIVPMVKELTKKHGQRWSIEFRPLKEEMRGRIVWLSNEGFQLDDKANLGTVPNSPGDKMRSSIIAYKLFNRDEMKEEEVNAAVRSLTKAYLELVD